MLRAEGLAVTSDEEHQLRRCSFAICVLLFCSACTYCVSGMEIHPFVFLLDFDVCGDLVNITVKCSDVERCCVLHKLNYRLRLLSQMALLFFIKLCINYV